MKNEKTLSLLPTVEDSHGYGLSGKNLDEFRTGIIEMPDSI